MSLLEQFFILSLFVQIAHSIEELSTGFNKNWYLFTMPFWVFLLFEMVFTGFWILVLFDKSFPFRDFFQSFFLLLMLANGVQHLVWSGVAKKYKPGLITAPLHVIVFSIFYFKTLY